LVARKEGRFCKGGSEGRGGVVVHFQGGKKKNGCCTSSKETEGQGLSIPSPHSEEEKAFDSSRELLPRGEAGSVKKLTKRFPSGNGEEGNAIG